MTALSPELAARVAKLADKGVMPIAMPWGYIHITKRVVDSTLIRLTGYPTVILPWVTRHEKANVRATIPFESVDVTRAVRPGKNGEAYEDALNGIVEVLCDDLRQLREQLGKLTF